MNTLPHRATRTAVSASGLRKTYGSKVVLDGVDLTIAEGEVFALLGPNGAGKTTIVRILSTLIPADAGTATVEFERHRDVYRGDLNLVFAEPDGTPLDPDLVTRRFARRAARAGLLRLRFHDLRHTRATLLLEHGAPINYVAEQLGDTKETIMETYAHVTPKMRSAAVAAVAAAVDARTEAPTAEVHS